MANLECGFAGREKDIIRLSANLADGWRDLESSWGFDVQDYLDYGDSKFRCRLRLVAKAPVSFATRKRFHERYLLEPVRFGRNSVSLHGVKLEIDVPLDQPWLPTKDLNRHPRIYEIAEDAFSLTTSEGEISYRLQIWVVFQGSSTMFVKDQFEKGDGFAWAGGRPESNRRKF